MLLVPYGERYSTAQLERLLSLPARDHCTKRSRDTSDQYVHDMTATTGTVPLTAAQKKRWCAQRHEVLGWKAALGQGSDLQIVETVTILNVLGLDSSGSCQGHLQRGACAPWIDFQPADVEEDERVHEELRSLQIEWFTLIDNGADPKSQRVCALVMAFGAEEIFDLSGRLRIKSRSSPSI